MKLEAVNPHFGKVHLATTVIHVMDGPEPGDFHDHPWHFDRTVLLGWCVERVLDLATGVTEDIRYGEGDMRTFSARHIHKVIEVAPGGYVSACVYGPTIRTSRFYRFIAGRWKTRTWWPDSEFSDDFTEHP